jgi:hydroxyethylthiazole kinase-like uncharacterized protein yjeF
MGRAVRATHTITFIGLKPGLLTLDGPDHCGEITVADLGLPAKKANAWVASRELFQSVLRPRPRNFHKGMAGSVAILGGASGMAGAALLAGRAALKLGAGRVYVGMLDQTLALDPGAPELMLRHADDALGLDLEALVIGPGLGDGERAETLLGAGLSSELPCVLDADALNLLAGHLDWLRAHAGPVVLTPHPGEFARLLGCDTAAVQAQRQGLAARFALEHGVVLALKGHGTVVTDGQRRYVNTTGNPGMATGGTGDVLAGLIGALLGQGLEAFEAAQLGVYLHGLAGDLARDEGGEVSLIASDLLAALPRAFRAHAQADRAGGKAGG